MPPRALEEGAAGVSVPFSQPWVRSFEAPSVRPHSLGSASAPLPGSSPWEVRPFEACLGAEVRGVDLAAVTADEARKIEELVLKHRVVFFRNQENLTPEKHVEFGKLFGVTRANPQTTSANKKGLEEVFQVKAKKQDPKNRGWFEVFCAWHSDLTCEEEPETYGILKMHQLPRAGLGDTMWADLVAAYNALPPALQERCEGLTGLHECPVDIRGAAQFGPFGIVGDPGEKGDAVRASYVHPLVRRHPQTGEKALYLNELYCNRICELSPQESRALLDRLNRHAVEDRFVLRYAWAPQDVVIWDNRNTLHRVVGDFDPDEAGERHSERVTVMRDDRVEAANPEAVANAKPWVGETEEDQPLVRHLRKAGKLAAAPLSSKL